MNGSIARWASVLSIAVSMGACGSADGENKADVFSGAPIPLSALGEAYETLLCKYLMQCAGAGYLTLEECKADREPQGLADLEAAVAESRIEYDAEAIGDCRAALEAHICELPYLFVPTVPEIVDDCLENQGKQTSGDPCRDDIECAPGLYCSMQDYACPGTCRPLLDEGAVCSIGSELRCGPRLDLDITLTELYSLTPDEFAALVDQYEGLELDCVNERCEAPIALGQPCSIGSTCLDGYCDAGTCRASATQGEPCTTGDACGDGLFCLEQEQSATGSCQPMSTAGGPCTFNGDCKDDLRCVRLASDLTGECSAPRARGEACGANNDCAEGFGCIDERCGDLPGAGAPCLSDDCAMGFVCRSDVCVALVHPGDPCNEADAICLGRCRDGQCAARASLGEPCDGNDDCASRACIGGTCVDDELCEFRTGNP